MTPIFEDIFYHDGRGPELQRVIWSSKGSDLLGFEYFNPDDKYETANLKHLRLKRVEAYAMAGEEVHGNILANSSSKAAIIRVEKSDWMKSFNQYHLKNCHHFQIVFYDEIFDVICEKIIPGNGPLADESA
jgi:hypothetical protein